MKILRRFMFLGLLILMCFSVWRTREVRAQGSCNYEDVNWAYPCSTTKTDCLGSASSTRTQCYANCDNQYGSGTPADQTCRSNCDTNYNNSANQCNTDYNNCMQQRNSSCPTLCQSTCDGYTGYTCCAYDDAQAACDYSCGCLLSSKPDCSPLIAQCDSNGGWTCNSPIVIDVNGDGFQLTSIENGAWFDLSGAGRRQLWSWTALESDDGFLALDRNGNGIIDDGTELFGNNTPQPPSASQNGFLALAVYDKPENGGNGDGFIDSQDAIYSKLRIWIDKNHDGVSQPNELHTLSELGIGRIDLQYQVKPRIDQYGNGFALRSRIWDIHGNQGGRWAWDVYFRTK